MDDALRYDRAVSPELIAIVPETLAEAEELAASIEQAVHRETGGAVRNLSVEIGREEILLRGSCPSFYCKQLAQTAAMAVPAGKQLSNCIEVE
ncbi:MAG: BON domain-containing protein [Thermoguttaceae bacterium]|jgi:osmotically-inducible protein OsmY